MATLKDLVPPLELCREIPEGEFAESALVQAKTWADTEPFVAPREAAIENNWEILAPAPTLAEIMEKLYPGELKRHDEWIIQSNGVRKIGAKPATVALMLWFELENKNA